MKNKNSQNKDIQIVQLIISLMMIILLLFTIHAVANTTLTMLDPKLESVLVRINALFDYKSLIRMLLGTLYIVIVSATFFIVGMIGLSTSSIIPKIILSKFILALQSLSIVCISLCLLACGHWFHYQMLLLITLQFLFLLSHCFMI